MIVERPNKVSRYQLSLNCSDCWCPPLKEHWLDLCIVNFFKRIASVPHLQKMSWNELKTTGFCHYTFLKLIFKEHNRKRKENKSAGSQRVHHFASVKKQQHTKHHGQVLMPKKIPKTRLCVQILAFFAHSFPEQIWNLTLWNVECVIVCLLHYSLSKVAAAFRIQLIKWDAFSTSFVENTALRPHRN